MLFSHNTGKALNASKTDGVSLTYITTSNVYWNSFELDNLKIMPFTDSEIEKCTVKKGDLLVCEGGDIGRAAIWQFENEIRIQNHLHRLRPYDRIYTKFYYYIMYLYKANGRINGNGIGLQGLSSNALHNIIVPVPPVEEQKRIVDSIDSVLSLIEQIESHKQNLSSQIDNIKSKILDLAIRGKLVPQDPNDEPASVLLERIRAEKEELIKQGKIKRDKKESVIFKGDDNSYYEKIGDEITCIDDFLPFDIPETWTWTRLKNIGDVIGGGTPKTNNHNYWDGAIPWVTPADLSGYNNMYIAHGSRFITELGLKESSAQLLPKDSVLFSSRAPIGYIAIAENAIATNQGFKSVSPYISGISEYLYFCLKRCTDDIIQRASGTTFKEISGSEMSETLVPIPSLNEQKKIVNRISDLFAVINNVEASLN